ncbi:adenosylcobinamide-GDP ribazoletransferase [Spirochaetia bacterium]|nr:adenosylcobinamide-GDP ribazoletransferase [Spirochaetia bacterium]
MFDRFLSTLSVVSRIPVKVKFTFDASRMDFYLPLIGICPALPGLLLFAVYSFFCNYAGENARPGIPALTIALILLVQYLGFNLFHLDGLMDTADAFLGSADRERRLGILKDSRIGVYGFFAGFTALSLKAILLYSLFPVAHDFPALVFAYPLWGRFSAALIPCMAGPLTPGGLGALARGARPRRCFGGIAFALFLWTFLAWGMMKAAACTGPLPFNPQLAGNNPLRTLIVTALCLFVICPFTAFYYARLYRKTLGGYTGDALGAAIETAEILCLASAL